MLYIIFISVIFILLLMITKLLVDIRRINKQLSIKIHTNHNFIITSDFQIREHRELCDNLNLLYEKYHEEKMNAIHIEKELKEMITYIAHDIRTPLTSVQGYLQILEEENISSENVAYYNIIHQRIHDIHNLLEHFFIYSKLIHHDYMIDESDCNLYDICCDSLAGFYHQFSKKNIEPMILFKQQDFTIRANKELLNTMFNNLIHNALVHGCGNINIIQDGRVFMISNQMEKNQEIDVNHVFDRFYKGDTSRSTISSGLGLAIVKEIVQMNGGSVHVEIKDDVFKVMIHFSNEEKRDTV